MGIKPAIRQYGDLAIMSVENDPRQMESKAVWGQYMSVRSMKTVISLIKEKYDASGTFENLKVPSCCRRRHTPPMSQWCSQ